MNKEVSILPKEVCCCELKKQKDVNLYLRGNAPSEWNQNDYMFPFLTVVVFVAISTIFHLPSVVPAIILF
jgi:hypothetical protein